MWAGAPFHFSSHERWCTCIITPSKCMETRQCCTYMYTVYACAQRRYNCRQRYVLTVIPGRSSDIHPQLGFELLWYSIMTAISVSAARTMMLSTPISSIFFSCRRTTVSASSWLFSSSWASSLCTTHRCVEVAEVEMLICNYTCLCWFLPFIE